MIDNSLYKSIKQEIADVLRPAKQEGNEITVREYADLECLSRDVAYCRLVNAVNAKLMTKRKVLTEGRWLTVFKLAAQGKESET